MMNTVTLTIEIRGNCIDAKPWWTSTSVHNNHLTVCDGSTQTVFTARRYASAVYTVLVCPSVRPSVTRPLLGSDIMAYQIAAVRMTLGWVTFKVSHLLQDFMNCHVFPIAVCSRWQVFNRHSASRSPSAIAELLAYIYIFVCL